MTSIDSPRATHGNGAVGEENDVEVDDDAVDAVVVDVLWKAFVVTVEGEEDGGVEFGEENHTSLSFWSFQ